MCIKKVNGNIRSKNTIYSTSSSSSKYIHVKPYNSQYVFSNAKTLYFFSSNIKRYAPFQKKLADIESALKLRNVSKTR